MQEERAEQLRSFSFLSGIVAGFAIASFLQLDFNVTSDNPKDPNKPLDPTPQSWQLGFAISVGLTVRTNAVLTPVHAFQSLTSCNIVLFKYISSLQAALAFALLVLGLGCERTYAMMLDCMALTGSFPAHFPAGIGHEVDVSGPGGAGDVQHGHVQLDPDEHPEDGPLHGVRGGGGRVHGTVQCICIRVRCLHILSDKEPCMMFAEDKL